MLIRRFLIASAENKASARVINKWGLLVPQLKISGSTRLPADLPGLQIHCFAALCFNLRLVLLMVGDVCPRWSGLHTCCVLHRKRECPHFQLLNKSWVAYCFGQMETNTIARGIEMGWLAQTLFQSEDWLNPAIRTPRAESGVNAA